MKDITLHIDWTIKTTKGTDSNDVDITYGDDILKDG